MALTVKDALRAEDAGGMLTDMSAERAAVLLAETDASAQPLLHTLLSAAHTHALASEALGRVLGQVRAQLAAGPAE